VEEGDDLPVSEIELTADRIREYARAAGMWAPRFTDDGSNEHGCVCGSRRGAHLATGDGRAMCRADAPRRGWRR